VVNKGRYPQYDGDEPIEQANQAASNQTKENRRQIGGYPAWLA